ncbi:endonuclease/exonuclease/phosphatase family protein [Amaricoccus solimangrovi]|uniref:EEP domain-containing protein n=1 Tax=Amaricoccus solimangrovi TaxID=2589815 RepID=A0A501WLN0_9RHOB|nr:endonuclease/exonuclease/phosphatase family protein [Amaricoccus solimangrovi]TPE47951.1 EEP domain-containing protein [Amaricoccus solimangrovi]
MAATALFASYNVHKCVGTDRRFDPGRIAAVIAEIDPDVIALQEADRRFGDRRGLLDLAALREATGLEPVPVANGHMGHGWHGNLLLFRGGGARQVRQVTLPGLEPRGALMADLALAQGAVRVLGVHLGLLRRSRLLQVGSLLGHAAETTDLPTVLMGDMNEWRRERRSALSGFAAGFGPVGAGVPSFPAYFPVLALDRMIARPAGVLGQVETHDSPLARRASDHLPIKARITLG